MGDQDAKMKVYIEAVADEKSAKKATKDLTQNVLESLKSGYIEIPATISDEFDNKKASAKLIKAQGDFVKQWKKMSAKGFSSSEKDLSDFSDKYLEYKRLLGKEGKSGSKQNLALRDSGLGEILQFYKSTKRGIDKKLKQVLTGETNEAVLDAIVKQEERQSKKAEKDIKRYKKVTDSKKKIAKKHEEINKLQDTIWEQQNQKRNEPDASIDLGKTNEYDMKQSEKSSYRSSLARQTRQSMKETYQANKDSLVVYNINDEGVDQSVKDSLEKSKGTYIDPIVQAKGMIEVFKKDLPNLLEGLANSSTDKQAQTIADKIYKEADAIYKLSGTAGKTVFSAAKGQIGAAMSKYFPHGGNIGGTEGDDPAEASYNPKVEAVLKGLLNKVQAKQDDIVKGLNDIEEASKTSQKDRKEVNSFANRFLNSVTTNNNAQKQSLEKVDDSVKGLNSTTQNQVRLDMVEHSEERIADSREAEQSKEMTKGIQEDAGTGFNTDAKADELIAAVKALKIDGQVSLSDKATDILSTISSNVKLIAEGLGFNKKEEISNLPTLIPPETTKALTVAMEKSGLPDLYRYFKDGKWLTAGVVDHDEQKPTINFEEKSDNNKLHNKYIEHELERERNASIRRNANFTKTGFDKIQLSQDFAAAFSGGKVLNAIKRAFGIAAEESMASKISGMSQAEVEKLRAERISKYGLSRRPNDPSTTGAKAQAQYTKAIYGWGSRRQNVSPFKDLQLTEGIGLDSKAITNALQTTLEKNMFKAQTGGTFRNLLGSMTLYAGMPSLEKTRAEADALNTVMAKIRQVILDALQKIQSTETDLRGLEAKGDAKFDAQGHLMEGSSKEAETLFANLEEQKEALRLVLAEITMIDEKAADTNYNAGEILRTLGFVSPELRDCNNIIKNINAGLDKNGKVLKFQTRTQEVLNYSFQLMARHVGQMIKNWMLMLNPINLIKKAFSDFASYDVKWQRTMNVIKYNIRRIIRPFMEWLAQQFVNLIGLANALIKGIGKAFNKDWDLFDQSAASAEQMREELEQAANVTAGFDELHDIGGESSSNPALDLMGDIYTPQWDGLNDVLEQIGLTIGKIIDAVSNFTFWDWLALAGAALVGFLALKALISWFTTGKNPLETVAKGFQFLEKAVGWAILIAAFSLFVVVLTDFVECMKTASWEDIVKSLLMLGGAFILLVASMWAISKFVTTDWKTLLGMAALVAVFDALVLAMVPFINALKDVTSTELAQGLLFLVGALAAVAGTISLLLVVLSAITATGVGALAIALLALILATTSLVILAIAELVRAIGEAAPGIKIILEEIKDIVIAIGNVIVNYVETIIKTIGDIIIGIINTLISAIPRLLSAILNFCREIGPAIENSADAIMRTITKVINFTVSAIEYLINLVIGGVNDMISAINKISKYVGINIPQVPRASIPRFVPQYEQGTNYVPNNGLAYLHQGEAVIPKKYNQPYNTGMSAEEKAFMSKMMSTMSSLDSTMKAGIPVTGQFVQRGSDLVAVVNKTKSQTGADLLSNVAYAR